MSDELPIPRRRILAPSVDDGRTKQSDAIGSDINAIMSKYVLQGVTPPGQAKQPRYGDFTGYGDFHSCMDRILEAQTEFMRIHPAARALARNDPGRFLEMVSDPARVAELRALGLLEGQLPAAVADGTPTTPEPSPVEE